MKKRAATINYDGVKFLQRNDLKDFKGRRNGAYHIEHPDRPGEGLCFYSSSKYLEMVKSKPTLLSVGSPEYPAKICHSCLGIYKHRKATKTTTGESDMNNDNMININGVLYRKLSVVEEEVLLLKATLERSQELLTKSHNRIHTLSDGTKVIDGLSYIPQTATRGELRTLQGIRMHVDLLPNGKNKYTTHLVIKTTQAEYIVGTKIRIIKDDQP